MRCAVDATHSCTEGDVASVTPAGCLSWYLVVVSACRDAGLRVQIDVHWFSFSTSMLSGVSVGAGC